MPKKDAGPRADAAARKPRRFDLSRISASNNPERSGGQPRPRGGRRSRDKGDRTERALVKYLQQVGFAAERVPLSGSARGRFGGDLSVPLLGIDRRAEAKCRADGFRELYRWLGGVDFLIIRADRRDPLVVLPLKLAAEIAAAAERSKVVP